MEIIFTYMQSVTSFRSGLLISSSPLPDGQSSSVVSMAGHSSDNEESVTSSPINSPTGMDNIQLLMDTVRQLTSDKEELQAQVDSLSQQLQQVFTYKFIITQIQLRIVILMCVIKNRRKRTGKHWNSVYRKLLISR